MISDLEIAQACAASYLLAPTIPQTSPLMPYVVISTASDGETLLVTNRGSKTWQDWLRDFLFQPIETREHPQLGPCHGGFLSGAESIVDQLDAAIDGRPYICGGHSLGGAEAVGEAALMICRGKPPQAIVTFGAPRFGMARLVEFLAPYPIRQYRRDNDIVPQEPPTVAPLLEFLDTRSPLIAIGDALGLPIGQRHSINGYVTDVGTYLGAEGKP